MGSRPYGLQPPASGLTLSLDSQIRELREAIQSGVRVVSAGGTTTTFDSLDAMYKRLDELERTRDAALAGLQRGRRQLGQRVRLY